MENQEAPGWSRLRSAGTCWAPVPRKEDTKVISSHFWIRGFAMSALFRDWFAGKLLLQRRCGARLRVADRLKARTNRRVGCFGFHSTYTAGRSLPTVPLHRAIPRGIPSRVHFPGAGGCREEGSHATPPGLTAAMLIQLCPPGLQLRRCRQPLSVFLSLPVSQAEATAAARQEAGASFFALEDSYRVTRRLAPRPPRRKRFEVFFCRFTLFIVYCL